MDTWNALPLKSELELERPPLAWRSTGSSCLACRQERALAQGIRPPLLGDSASVGSPGKA